jgi:hypothetical protein
VGIFIVRLVKSGAAECALCDPVQRGLWAALVGWLILIVCGVAMIYLRARSFLGAVCASFLAGCALPVQTPYQPLQDNGGFSEQRIEANRFRVNFEGNSLTTREEVENNLLFRIAELTLSQGCDYFVLSDNDTEANTIYLQTMMGYDTFDPFYPRFWPRTGFVSGTATPITSYKAQAYVLMFKGTKPENEINAYDAHAVQTSLAPLIQRRQPTPH